MFFAQIVAFILVMVLFEAYQPGVAGLRPLDSVFGSLAALCCLWAAGQLAVRRLLERLAGADPPADPARAARRLESLLHGGAIVCFVLMITALDLKAQLMAVPALAQWQTLSGLCAAGIYLCCLVVVWWTMQPLEARVFYRDLGRWAHVWAQARFVAPVLFPWLIAVAVQDLALALWPAAEGWLRTAWGDLAFLSLLMILMSLLFPPLVRRWWGCRPLPDGPTREVAARTLRRLGVSVAEIVDWPILEGRVLTAGILGLAPGLRYLLITKALAQSLDEAEMAAVTAHEAGHVRHRHMLAYILFFLGFFLAVFALTGSFNLLMGWLVYLLSAFDWGMAALSAPAQDANPLTLLLALPLVIFLALYVRFGMGFFMRHFERQADFFSLEAMGSADPLIGALERIASLSGNIRDVPSWHHFSVAQRVEALRQAQAEPRLVAAHGRMLRRALLIYGLCLSLLVGAGLTADYSGAGSALREAVIARLLEERAALRPDDAGVRLELGLLRYQQGDERRALGDLRMAVDLDPDNAEALNSLAWLLVTAKEESLRRPERALILAEKAVRLRPEPHIWDTLAEAYLANGRPDQAEAAAAAALAAGPKEQRAYFEEQYQRFKRAAQEAKDR